MKKRIAIIVILAILAVLGFWFFYALRSYVVMGIYSAQHEKESVMRRTGFDIAMPSGCGWYPFVMTYNADGFGQWSGTGADMSIMYNFGAFDAGTRTSSIYDTDSDKYASFYGAYAVRTDNGVFGFEDDGSADLDDVALAFEYDYTQLVISAFGCDDTVFAVEDISAVPDVTYLDSGGWARIDAVIAANGTAHNYRGYRQPYLQYGRPMADVPDDFAVTALFGRVYMKHLEEYGCTVLLYVIAPTQDAVDAYDDDVLAHACIRSLQQ